MNDMRSLWCRECLGEEVVSGEKPEPWGREDSRGGMRGKPWVHGYLGLLLRDSHPPPGWEFLNE